MSQPDEEGMCDCSDCGIFFTAEDGYFLDDGIPDLGRVIFPDYYAHGYPWETGYEKQVSGCSVAQDGADIMRVAKMYREPAGVMLRDAIRHAEIQGVKVPGEAYLKLASMNRTDAHSDFARRAQACLTEVSHLIEQQCTIGAIKKRVSDACVPQDSWTYSEAVHLKFVLQDCWSYVYVVPDANVDQRRIDLIQKLRGLMAADLPAPAKDAYVAHSDGHPIIWADSARWTFDRGAMPGEPFAFLDGDSETATAVMVEIQTPGRPTAFEVRGVGGRRISEAAFPEEAARLAEACTPSARPLVPGDKVFVASEQRLATVLDIYGDGLNGEHGEVRVDLCGNTAVTNLEHYDPAKHAQFDATFTPIRREWIERYGITQDVPVRDESDDPVITASIQCGILTMPCGTTIDLKVIQAACNYGFQETGEECLMQATDALSSISGYWQGPHGQFLRNEERGEFGHFHGTGTPPSESPPERPRS